MTRSLGASLALSLILLLTAGGAAPAQEPRAAATPKIAVVLSGGSAFGMAHIGVLRAIEKAGIPIDLVLGTSMGSLVAGLYAAGYTPDQMEDIVTTMDWNAVFMDQRASVGDRFVRTTQDQYSVGVGYGKDGLNLGAGLLAGQNILAKFTELTLHALPYRDFDDLPCAYRAVAADIMTGEKVVFAEGSIAEAMRSSMSIPALFLPYESGGRRLVDGGIVDNLPVDVARELGADIVIAVESRGPGPKGPESLNSPLAIAGQTFNLFILQNMRPNRAAADLLVSSDLGGFSTASYAEAEGIIRRGDEAGDRAMPKLEALAGSVAALRPLVPPEKQPNRRAFRDPPPILALRIEGGSPADAVFARSVLSPLIGRAYTRKEFAKAIGTIYESGNFDFVKFDLDPRPEGVVGVLTLKPDKAPDNLIFLGLDFSGAYSKAFSSEVVLRSGLLLRGFSGKDSALLLSSSLVSKVRASVEYFQPLGPFFLKPWARYNFEYDIFASETDPIMIGTKFRSFGAGAWAGLVLGRDADLMIGYSYENRISLDDLERLLPRNVGALRGSFRLDTRESAVFPARGLALSLYGRWFDPAFGGGEAPSFVQAELSLQAVIPLGKADTFALSAFGGSDLTWLFPGLSASTLSYYSNLRQVGMFYGLGRSGVDTLGNHALGFSLEYRHRIALLNQLLGGDVYLLGNASAGKALDSAYSASFDERLVTWNASLGLGFRLSRRFGLVAALSAVGNADQDSDEPLGFALSLEFGSFRQRAEDNR
ncbi:MAG: patatin-like phospholipase family protein [Spirochaetaceae bacterium]|nr:patatin-like phospholipase family protein [Spirochaetaceae bacterium]